MIDTLTRLLQEAAKGYKTYLGEQEESAEKGASLAAAQIAWMERMAGGPQGALDAFGDQYLTLTEKATRGIGLPTRDEPIMGEEEQEVETSQDIGIPAPEEGSLAQFLAPRGTQTITTKDKVKVPVQKGTRKVLALQGPTRLTLADIFPEAAKHPFGQLPIPVKDGVPDLSTASLIGQRMGWTGEGQTVNYEINGQVFKIPPAVAANFAFQRLQAGEREGRNITLNIDGIDLSLPPDKAADILADRAKAAKAEGRMVQVSIDGQTFTVPPETAAQIASSYRNARLPAGKGDKDDQVLRRQVINDIRDAESDIAGLESEVDAIRRQAVAASGGATDPGRWGPAGDEYRKKQAQLVAARGRLKARQDQAKRMGITIGAGEEPAPGPAQGVTPKPGAGKTIKRSRIAELAKRNNMSEADVEKYFRDRGYTVAP